MIFLEDRRTGRLRSSRGPAAFFFAVDCPISYLVAEGVERALGEIEWVPVPPLGRIGEAVGSPAGFLDERFALAEAEARRLRLPLARPERFPFDARRATRAASAASELGAAAAFTLALARLTFAGGYAPDEDEVLAEAAAAAGLEPAAMLDAAHDPEHDQVLAETEHGLRVHGCTAVPAIRIGTSWFGGLTAVSGAARHAAHAER